MGIEHTTERRRRDRSRLRCEPQPLAANCLSPLRGLLFFRTVFLGLTPQAKHLSPLRGSERRRRDRPLAWGVSPRWWGPQNPGALKGRQIVAAA